MLLYHPQKLEESLQKLPQDLVVLQLTSGRTGYVTIHQKLANFFKFQSISIRAMHSDRRQETVSVPSNSLR